MRFAVYFEWRLKQSLISTSKTCHLPRHKSPLIHSARVSSLQRALGSRFSAARGKKRLNKLNPSPAWWDPMLCLPLWWNAISSSPDLSIVPGYSRVIPILKHCPVGYEITNCWLSHEPSELLYTLVSAKDHSSAIMDNLPCSHTFPQRDTRPGEVHNIFFTKLRCQGKGYD